MTGSGCQFGRHRLCRTSPAEALPRAVVEALLDRPQVVEGERAQVAALGEVLAEQAVGVLIRAAQPGDAGVGEEDAVGEELPEEVVAGHLRALVPGHRL